MSRTKQVKKAVKTLKKSSPATIILAVILIVVSIGGYFVYDKFFKNEQPTAVAGDLSFHFITLGNDASGDCVFVKAGDNDILIDAGSDYDSLDDITNYIDQFVTDGKLEFVIATHAHLDHIARFAGDKNGQSIFDEYIVETIIDFPLTNATTAVYKRYIEERDAEVLAGADHFTALECYNNLNGAKSIYNLTDDGAVKMEILYNTFYEKKTSNENNYSVCLQFLHGDDRAFLFTGDLEDAGEEALVKNNTLKQVELYKAGHHGSYTASTNALLSVIQPNICVVTGVAGDKYNFPHQDFINRISKYTESVYMTTKVVDGVHSALNGNVVVASTQTAGVTVTCSAQADTLKNTDWFKQNRKWN